MNRFSLSFAAAAVLVISAPNDARAGSLFLAAGRGAARGVTRAIERNAVRSLDSRVVRSVERRQLRALTRRDLLNHQRASIVPLAKPRPVFRFTTREQAGRELRFGILPNRHMTVSAKPGRPLSAETARRRFGLPRKPEVRETITIPVGQPVRLTRVVGGSRGIAEITSPRRIPPAAIKWTIPLSRRGE